jgi:hypothetical protein
MRFWGLIKKKQILNLLVLLLCFCSFFTCQKKVAGPLAQEFIEAQKYSQELLVKYVNSPDMRKRIEIERLEGLYDILPAKIFRAWRIYSNNCYYPTVCEDALNVLLQNPDLSVIVLRNIIEEPKVTDEIVFNLNAKFGVQIPVDEKGKYLNFCAKVVTKMGDNTTAFMILKEIENHLDEGISREAHELISLVETENCVAKSNLYTEHKNQESLYWLERNCLEIDMSIDAVQKILGVGEKINDNKYVYYTKSGSDNQYLFLTYDKEFNYFLESWEWKDSIN